MTPYTLLSSATGLPRLLARTRRVRLASMAVGAMLGAAAGAYLPHTVHAAPVTDAPVLLAQATPKSVAKTSKPAKKVSRRKKAVAAKIAETQLAPLPEATAQQVAAAERVLIGRYDCEFNKTLIVDRNDKNLGYVNVTLGKQSWVTTPVVSSTGTIRLEDTQHEALLLQILTKSMLMNIKTGQRMVDGCVHEVQRAAEVELQKAPRTASFFGTPDGQLPNAPATAP